MNMQVSTTDTSKKFHICWDEPVVGTDLNSYIIEHTHRELDFFGEVFTKPLIAWCVAGTFTDDTKRSRICQYELDNSTSQREQAEDLNLKVQKIFALAIDEEFEDGIENNFSKKFIAFIKEHSNDGIGVLAPMFINEKINVEIISEALRWIGRLEHPETEYYRLWLLESCLFCNSPSIRDGAILGLASIDEPSAIAFIRKAIDEEPIRELQEDMTEILSQLEA